MPDHPGEMSHVRSHEGVGNENVRHSGFGGELSLGGNRALDLVDAPVELQGENLRTLVRFEMRSQEGGIAANGREHSIQISDDGVDVKEKCRGGQGLQS